jgi:hypothetical protein
VVILIIFTITRTKRHAPVEEDPYDAMKSHTKRIWDALGNDVKTKAALNGSSGRRLSWATVNTLENVTASLIDSIGVKDIKSKSFRKLLRPLAFSDELVYNALFTFCGSIVDYVPRVQQDRRYYDLICVILSSKVCVRLYGLLAHFCFWNVIHPCARNALTAACATEESSGKRGKGSTEVKHRKSTVATIKAQLNEYDAVCSPGANNSDDDDSVGSNNVGTPFNDYNYSDAMSASKNSLREHIFSAFVQDDDDASYDVQSTARFADFSEGGLNIELCCGLILFLQGTQV